MSPAKAIFGTTIAGVLLLCTFAAGFATHWAIVASPVSNATPPPATPNVPASKVIKAKTLEITDDDGTTYLWLTAEGKRPSAIVMVDGKPVRMDLAKLTRYAQVK